MNPIGFSFLTLLCLSLVIAQERTQHGLAYENPKAFPPSAYNFFHPNATKSETKDPCAESKCSPLPLAAKVEATQIHHSNNGSTLEKSGKKLGLGVIVGIIFGVVFVVFIAMSVHNVMVTRKNNNIKANNNVQPYV
ncbi:PREDICTED: uncharacterized protein LOC109350604 [Lupinus angustifolius]|uniref:uncharacterized protein LOC109350604 n=1 Tax=Lupinus angustifolius TaxID=3871 RepID=UPI00092E7AA5|nr:PREDICTED: uncharacterized protein LOC109350604 [Lupinus angustifolius]